MKDLPNVFANKIDNAIKNVQEVFYGSKQNTRRVEEVLDHISDSGKYIFKQSVEIITKGGKSVEKIALRTKDYLLTLSNKKINIGDIVSINEIKK